MKIINGEKTFWPSPSLSLLSTHTHDTLQTNNVGDDDDIT